MTHRSRGRSRLPLLVTALAACLASNTFAATAAEELVLTGDGVEVAVAEAPFRLVFRDTRTGRTLEQLAADGAPVRAGLAGGPQPAYLTGDVGGYGPLSFAVGAAETAVWPANFYAGNELQSVTAGAVFHPTSVTNHATTDRGHRLTLETTAGLPATLDVTFPSPGQVRIAFAPPAVVDGDPVVAVGDAFVSPADEQLYGLGERKDTVAQRGRLRTAWVEEQNNTNQPESWDPLMGDGYQWPNGAGHAWYPQTLFYTSRGYGIAVHTKAQSQYDLAASRPDMFRFQVFGSRLEYTLQMAPDVRTAVRGLTSVTGRSPVAPDVALEPWIDALYNAATLTDADAAHREVYELVDAIEAHRLQAQVKVIGIEPWSVMDDAPGGAPGSTMMEEVAADLLARGYTLSAYHTPFVIPGSDLFVRAWQAGVLVEDPAGGPYIVQGPLQVPTAMWDFTHPDVVDLWGELVGRSLDLGFRAFMADWGEQILPHARFANGETGETMHNGYPIAYAAATKAAIDRWNAARGSDEDVFFYMRSGFTGAVSSTGGVFPGDESGDHRANGLPSLVPAMLNLSLGGVPYFTTDVASYFGTEDPELVARWNQLAALSPLLRNHASPGGNQFPWHYGDEVLSIYRRYAELHHRLVPYLAAAGRAATSDGLGIARPLFIDDPATPIEWLDRQYLLGDDLLVAPVLEPGATTWDAWLPASSSWIPMTVTDPGCLEPSGPAVAGGTKVTTAVDLDLTPLWLRTGATNPAPCP